MVLFSSMMMNRLILLKDLMSYLAEEKTLQEDFAQIAERTEETHGKNYKYDFSYEEMAELLKRYVNAYSIEVEKYFNIIFFNYLFSNGDSHLKNFSLFRNEKYGDYLLPHSMIC